MKLLLRSLIFTLIVSFSCASALAQAGGPATTTRDQTVIDQFIQEVLTLTAERSGEQAAKVELLTRAEKKAKDDLDKTIDSKKKADRALEAARLGVADTRPRKHGGAQSIDMADYDLYQRNVRLMTVEQSNVSEFGSQEREERARLEKAQREKELANQVMSEMQIGALQERNALKRSYDVWNANKTDQNFKELTALLTKMSTRVNNKSDVEFVSEDSQHKPTAGAQIKYETDVERKNNSQPIKGTPCTTVMPPTQPTCVNKDMPKVWYYMWAVRGESATSSKDNYVHVGGTKPTIKVVEDY
jgi:hypothetical protein